MTTGGTGVARRCLLTGLALAALAVPATSLGAPRWHAPVYPSLPAAGTPPLYGSLAVAAGSGGKASVLFRGDDDALWTVSRASGRAKWTPARRWRTGAHLSDSTRIAAALGPKLTALWTTRSGGLATATGSLRSGGRVATLRSGGRVASPALHRTPAGLAYSFAAGTPAAAFGGLSAAGARLRGAAPIDATSRRTDVQTGADAAGNMTAAWAGPDGRIRVATKPGTATAWSTAVPLPGSTGGVFSLAVAPNGAAAVVYVGSVVRSPRPTGPGTYLARVELLLAQRPAGGTEFGPPQLAGAFTQDPPSGAGIEFDGAWPSAAAVAINDTTVVLGYAAESFGEDPVGYYLSRAPLGAPLPTPTRLTDPRVRGLSEVTSWTLSGIDLAIDPSGTAGFVAGGTATQAVTDSLFATTSTAAAPGWTRMTDVARCDSRAGGGTGIRLPSVTASPSGGLVAAWVCERDLGDRIGVAAFDSRAGR